MATNAAEVLQITVQEEAEAASAFMNIKQDRVHLLTLNKEVRAYLTKPMNGGEVYDLRAHLEKVYAEDQSILEVFLADPRGTVLLSTRTSREGSSLTISEQYNFVESAHIKQKQHLLPEYDVMLEEQVLLLTEPVIDKATQQRLGIVGLRIKLADISHFLNKDSIPWESYESYLVSFEEHQDGTGVLLTPSAFLSGENRGVLTQIVETENSLECYEDIAENPDDAFEREKEEKLEEENRILEGYYGERLIGSDFPLPTFNWCLLAEVSYEEVVEKELQKSLFIHSAVFVGLTIFLLLLLLVKRKMSTRAKTKRGQQKRCKQRSFWSGTRKLEITELRRWHFGLLAVLGLGLLAAAGFFSQAQPPALALVSYEHKKILYIDSYHEGYEWSDGVTRGIESTLQPTEVELLIHRMDTKRNPSEAYMRAAAQAAKEVIEEFRPDVVIVSDDNAFRSVVMEYYRDAPLPFVFSGLNWDASLYGAPYTNTTGMVEVSLTLQLIDHLQQYAAGDRVGYLTAGVHTERKNVTYYEELFALEFDEVYFVTTMAEWKNAFLQLQEDVDSIVFENSAGITDWDSAEAASFAALHGSVPVGTTNPWVMDVSLVGITKVPEEQGEWSAKAALRILGGADPQHIPVVTNQESKVFLNFSVAEQLGVVFVPELLHGAEIIDL